MKKFFIGIKNWFVSHRPTKRRLIQVYTALLYNANIKGFINGNIYEGKTKYACVPGFNCYSCPGAIGSCPLGSLQNALATSGTRSAYYIFGIIGLFGLLCARTICGFLCPVGLMQDLLHKIKVPKLKKSRFTRVLSYLKYVILAVFVVGIPLMASSLSKIPAFCKYICPVGTFEGGVGLLINPANNNPADPNRYLLDILGPIFTWKFAVLCAVIVACVFIFRPFCRFICPLGAIYGFFNRISLLGVRLDKNKCTDCGLCVAHCKMDIKHVGDHECINCGECIKICPAKAISWKGGKLFVRANEIQKPLEEEQQVSLGDIKNMKPLAPAFASADGGIDHAAPSPKNDVSTLLIAKSVSSVPDANLSSDSFDRTEVVTSDENAADKAADVANKQYDADNAKDKDGSADKEEQQHGGDNKENADKDEQGDKEKRIKRRGRGFAVRCTAWALAVVVLVGALVYFNFIDVQPAQTVNIEVGAEIPDFALKIYGKDENGKGMLTDNVFDIREHRGEVIVINFWATWCGPCVAEIPHFNTIANEYPEIKVVAVQGKADVDDVGEFIVAEKFEKNGAVIKEGSWADYKIIFLQDEVDGDNCKVFSLLGGTTIWPSTLIIDKNGKFTYIRRGQLSYEKLKSEVEKALNA